MKIIHTIIQRSLVAIFSFSVLPAMACSYSSANITINNQSQKSLPISVVYSLNVNSSDQSDQSIRPQTTRTLSFCGTADSDTDFKLGLRFNNKIIYVDHGAAGENLRDHFEQSQNTLTLKRRVGNQYYWFGSNDRRLTLNSDVSPEQALQLSCKADAEDKNTSYCNLKADLVYN